MPGRSRNPRRVVLPLLRKIKGWQAEMIARWDVESTIYDETVGGTGPRRRPRQPGEYPENSAAEWDRLALFMEATAGQAEIVREFARAQAAEIRGRSE